MDSEKLKIRQITEDAVTDLALDTISIGKQALIFTNTKRGAEKTAEEISKKIKAENLTAETRVELSELSNQILKALDRPTTQCMRLANCVSKGIAFHHSGLHSKQREIVEDNFRSGKIKIIASTPTLCLHPETRIWHGMSETAVSQFNVSNPVFALSQNKLSPMKALKIEKLKNFSELIEVSSVSDYKIRVTPNHKMFIKTKTGKKLIDAKNIKKNEKIATIGRINLKKANNPRFSEFIIDNKLPMQNKILDASMYYLVGAMLGDGYSGAETKNRVIKYKGSPTIVGKDEEIFRTIKETCDSLNLGSRRSVMKSGTSQLVLGKNKWFREFLCRCGIEKRERKHISNKLMVGELNNVAFLLKGLFDTDGYVESKGIVGFSNTSEKLVKQIQKLLLRFGIVSRIRGRKEGVMKIYEKEYATLKSYELTIQNKRCVVDFYNLIGFKLSRKQNTLAKIVSTINSNILYTKCPKCQYRVYRDVFSGRIKNQKKWGAKKLKVIKLLGTHKQLTSRELTKTLGFLPRAKEKRLNHHYELIIKKRKGNRGLTDNIWSLNEIGRWIFENIILCEKDISEFYKNKKCPLCGDELERVIKKGWRDADFEGDIFWDIIRSVRKVEAEKEVYDVVLSSNGSNNHLFVANGFIVHNSAGVDLPAFRTIIRDLKRYGHRGMHDIPVLEYLQMSGRAGRPKFDSYGESIAIATKKGEKERIFEVYVEGEPEDIYSKLAAEPVLRTYVLSLIASNFVATREQLTEFFSKTFWAHQFSDMSRIEKILDKVLGMLEDFEFIITSTKGNDERNEKEKENKEKNEKNEKSENSRSGFISAADIGGEKLRATIVGKRVAELYLDPLTAHHIINCIKKGAQKEKIDAFPLLQMTCATLEMRPLLNVRTAEYDDMQERMIKETDNLLMDEPSAFEHEFDDFLNSVKTAMMFDEWIDEKDEEYLMEKYNVRPGELHYKLNNIDWILYASEELARLVQQQKIIKDISKLRVRIKYGAREELLTLLRIPDVGKVRARKLYFAGIRDIGAVKNADLTTLTQLLGKQVALNVKKAVGEDFEKMSVSDGKRKGQLGLGKYQE